MKITIAYTTPAERLSIINTQTAKGLRVVEDRILSSGNSLVFDNLSQLNTAKTAYTTALKEDQFLTKLLILTPEQISDLIEDQVTDIKSAKRLFKRIFVILMYLVNNERESND